MDKNEAKFILSSLRPDGQDDDMPQAQEALAMAKSDPELAKWLEQERELDRMLCDKLCECPVPDGLRESILAGGNHTIRPRFHWREAMAWAAALILLVALGVTQLRDKSQKEFASYHTDMVDVLNGVKTLDMRSDDVNELRVWLASGAGPGEFSMPARLEHLSGLGCKVLDWNGNKVALICFKDRSNDIHDTVHLLVVNREALQVAPPESPPVFTSQNNIVTASWTEGDHSYILAGHGQENFLGKYF